MPTIPIPRRPQIELFTPFRTKARVAAHPYIDPRGTHLDTHIRIYRASPKAMIASITLGVGDHSHTVGGITLAAGVLYYARVRYQNETGWSSWSKSRFETTKADVDFLPIAVDVEPQPGGAIPFNPSWTVQLNRVHEILQWRTDTRHLGRRLRFEDERMRLRFTWDNLDQAKHDTLIAFIQARIDGRESFSTSGEQLGDRNWFPRGGSMEVSQVGNDSRGVGRNGVLWSVSIDAVEVFGDAPFTIDESEIGGAPLGG